MTPKRLKALPTAQPDTCRKCGSTTWLIQTENHIPIQLATTLLTDHTELAAKLNRLPTWNLHKSQPTFTIRHRAIWDMISTRQTPHLANHLCDLDFTQEHPNYFPSRITYEFTEEPRF